MKILMICEEQQLFENQFDVYTHGQGPSGGQVSQVNDLAGEEAVGHGVAPAYVPCIRNTGRYAKPEVGPPISHLAIALTDFCRFLFLHFPTVVLFFELNAKMFFFF